jgi:hypothetical protein
MKNITDCFCYFLLTSFESILSKLFFIFSLKQETIERENNALSIFFFEVSFILRQNKSEFISMNDISNSCFRKVPNNSKTIAFWIKRF